MRKEGLLQFVEAVKRTEKWLGGCMRKEGLLQFVEAVKRTEKWLRRLYEEKMTMWSMLRL